jgi:UDP-glucose 4-epimerase
MPKSLVTGGAGFIGSHLVDALLSLGHEVIVIDNESSDSHYWNPGAVNYTYDICDYSKTAPLYENIDYVFHTAAFARIQKSIDNPIECNRVNVLGTATVLQCAKENNVKRVINSSTSSIYGNSSVPNKEEQKENCLNPYSVSKFAAENLCSMYTSVWGLPTVSLRYFNVYGERQPNNLLLGIFYSQYINNEPLTVSGDGSQRRDFTYVKDIVELNIKAATEDIDPSFYGQVFNAGSGVNYSVKEIAEMYSKNISYIPSRRNEVLETLADISKTAKVFNWVPNNNLRGWL